jgi:hypothetical protein
MKDMLEAQARSEARGEASNWPKGFRLARQARAMAIAKLEGHPNDPEAAKAIVSKLWGEDGPAVKGLEGDPEAEGGRQPGR